METENKKILSIIIVYSEICVLSIVNLIFLIAFFNKI